MNKLAFLLVLSVMSLAAFAQDQVDDKWKFLIEPYMMFPSMKGNLGLGNVEDIPVDSNAGVILEALKMGGMLYFEARTPKWSICSDIIYMDLEQDVERRAFIQDGSVQMKQLAWEVSGLKKILPWLDAGLGLRLNSIKAGFDITASIGNNQTEYSRAGKETWLDPILIVGSQGTVANTKWTYLIRGDIGGFRIGSNFAWQIQPYIGYRFTELFQLSAGYRVIAMDFETGTGDDYLKYDLDRSGLVVRFGFNF